MNDAPVHLAIFGDIHGHLRLMFQLCRLWQLQHQTQLDGVLLCGDLGYYPEIGRLDKATRKFAARDEEELGFAYYFLPPEPPRKDPLLVQTLSGDPDDINVVRCPVVFCHGNHEDFELLERTTHGAALASVDAFDRIFFLRSGECTEVAGVRVGALGGAPEPQDDPGFSGESRRPVLDKLVSGRAAQRLVRHSFDVLLTHGAAIGSRDDKVGSHLIREVIDRRHPAYHVYGHHRHPSPPVRIGDASKTADSRSTLSVWFNDVNFQPVSSRLFQGPVEEGCMGVLRCSSADDHELVIIDEPWFRQVTYHTWRHR